MYADLHKGTRLLLPESVSRFYLGFLTYHGNTHVCFLLKKNLNTFIYPIIIVQSENNKQLPLILGTVLYL